jgi:hypothetical protein
MTIRNQESAHCGRNGFLMQPLNRQDNCVNPMGKYSLRFELKRTVDKLDYFGVPDLEVAIADVKRLGGAAEIPNLGNRSWAP